MQAVIDKLETIHVYMVPEEEKRPYTAFPLVCAFLCLLGIVGVTFYSADGPALETKTYVVSYAHDPEARDADPNSVTNRSQRRADLDIVTSNAY